jgi:hypothetical protein
MSGRRVARPCDHCRTRKVKCDYAMPCNRCQSNHLRCAYNTIRKRKGPKPGRGLVVESLRLQHPQNSTTPDNAICIGQPEREDYTTATDDTDQERPSSSRSHLRGSSHHVPSAPANVDPSGGLGDQLLEDVPNVEGYFTFDEFAENVLGSSISWQDASRFGGTSQHLAVTPSTITSQTSPTSLSESVWSPGSVGTIPKLDRVLERGVALFFKHMYPIYPLLDRSRIAALLLRFTELDTTESGLLRSVCALTLVTVEFWPTMTVERRMVVAREYIKQCLEARMSNNMMEHASMDDVLTSLFIAVAYFDMKCRKTSWFYLREAISLAHLAGINNPLKITDLNPSERTRRQRLYALLFITERGACIHDSFPVSIMLPPDLHGEVLPEEDPAIALGLSNIHRLFSLLDMNFVRVWNGALSSSSTEERFSELATLQRELRQPLQIDDVSETQRADILVTQQWLRLTIWQAALRLGLISSSAAEPEFGYTYPLELAYALRDVLRTLSPASIQAHGLGIFEKQFEIVYSLLDVLALPGSSHSADHHEVLLSLLLSLSASPKARDIYVRILQKRLSQDSTTGTGQKHIGLADVELLLDDRRKH